MGNSNSNAKKNEKETQGLHGDRKAERKVEVPPPTPPQAKVPAANKLSERMKDFDDGFKPLANSNRSVTFDERVLPSSQVSLEKFRPLTRALTFDSRQAHLRNVQGVKKVLFRKYFNAKPRRFPGEKLSTVDEKVVQRQRNQDAVVVVDPLSTGLLVAQNAVSRGYVAICVYSDTLEVMRDLVNMTMDDLDVDFAAIIYHDGSDDTGETLIKTVDKIKEPGFNVVAVIAGAETGIHMADKLSEALGVRTNGSSGSDARRNKFLMCEKVREAGFRAVKQRNVTKWADAEDFVLNELKPMPFKVVVKPVQSAGGEDVFLCESMDDVKAAFGNIQGKINALGLENTATLVQEFLTGTEYVVDTVSRDGVHKVVAMWEYDRRPVNSAPFVCFGMMCLASGEKEQSLADYVLGVLDALEIRNGPGHAEVKYCNGDPCLIEVGSCCHGGQGTFSFTANQCIGYNQASACVDAYLDYEAFHKIPDLPTELKRSGREAMLVSYCEGTLVSMPGMEEVMAMESFQRSFMHSKNGAEIRKTIDLFTGTGSIALVHDDANVVIRDYDRIHELAHQGLYEVKEKDISVKENKGVVVVVDPFSTGALVAKKVADRGYKCICLYSDSLENIENVAGLVPEGLELSFDATIAHNGNIDETVASLNAVVEGDIISVMPGAETGVLLSDIIANKLSLRCNTLECSYARRDKYLMGETLRAKGVRAVMQTKATEWNQAKAFIEEMNPKPFEVVLKPLESAGTDDVILCSSMEEAESVFNRILGKVNGLGLTNEAVLIQEYLTGTEYVIDTVTRDGVHKVTAVWEYDKRRVNGAAFVYFGVKLIEASSDVVKSVVDYQLTVLDALQVRMGPAHGEVKFCEGSPVLIEVGARCHGGEGIWVQVAERCVGYTQVDASLDAYLDADAFEALPDKPTSQKAYGCEAMLVSYHDGILKGMPGLAEIESLSSFIRKDIFIKVGHRITKSIDCFTTPGSVVLVTTDENVLHEHLQRIRELERSGLFDVECENSITE